MAAALSSIAGLSWKWAGIALGVVPAALLLGWLIRKAIRGASASTSSWRSYIGGQGLILFGFVLIGIALAWGSFTVGPHPGKVVQGKFVSFHVDPSKEAIIEEQDAENYRHIMVLTQTETPQDGSATITVYGSSAAGGKHEIGRIETANAWSRWDQRNSDSHLTITIATGAGAQRATKVNVLLFLSPE